MFVSAQNVQPLSHDAGMVTHNDYHPGRVLVLDSTASAGFTTNKVAHFLQGQPAACSTELLNQISSVCRCRFSMLRALHQRQTRGAMELAFFVGNDFWMAGLT